MSYIHPAALAARRKYWTRPDAYRFAAPGTPEAQMPGWLDPSATRVRLKEAQEEEERARAAAAQEEFEHKLAQLRWEVKKLKLEHELWCFEQKYGFNPDQPRDDRGRWTGGASSVGDAAAASSGDDSSATGGDAKPQPTRVAQAGFGTLIAEIPVPGGRRCVYNFGLISVVVPGAANFRCGPRAHWSGVTHGRLLNDN